MEKDKCLGKDIHEQDGSSLTKLDMQQMNASYAQDYCDMEVCFSNLYFYGIGLCVYYRDDEESDSSDEQWGLYFLHILTALLENYKLYGKGNMMPDA